MDGLEVMKSSFVTSGFHELRAVPADFTRWTVDSGFPSLLCRAYRFIPKVWKTHLKYSKVLNVVASGCNFYLSIKTFRTYVSGLVVHRLRLKRSPSPATRLHGIVSKTKTEQYRLVPNSFAIKESWHFQYIRSRLRKVFSLC